MLLADRGIRVSQALIGEGLRAPCPGDELADRLNELSEHSWQGGALFDPPSLELFSFLSETGSWAVQLSTKGAKLGHWVVVDAVSRYRGVSIRDPAVGSYTIPNEEFLSFARYTIVVFEMLESP